MAVKAPDCYKRPRVRPCGKPASFKFKKKARYIAVRCLLWPFARLFQIVKKPFKVPSVSLFCVQGNSLLNCKSIEIIRYPAVLVLFSGHSPGHSSGKVASKGALDIFKRVSVIYLLPEYVLYVEYVRRPAPFGGYLCDIYIKPEVHKGGRYPVKQSEPVLGVYVYDRKGIGDGVVYFHVCGHFWLYFLVEYGRLHLFKKRRHFNLSAYDLVEVFFNLFNLKFIRYNLPESALDLKDIEGYSVF